MRQGRSGTQDLKSTIFNRLLVKICPMTEKHLTRAFFCVAKVRGVCTGDVIDGFPVGGGSGRDAIWIT